MSNPSDREAYLITKALLTAARTLRALKHPHMSDSQEMEEMAEKYFPSWYECMQLEYEYKRALNAGYVASGPIDLSSIKKWLQKNCPDDVGNILPFDRPLRF